VYALKDLAKLEVPAEVLKAYHTDAMSFGRDYIIPKPFDKRLIDLELQYCVRVGRYV
jgi:hypothetical protein